MFIKEYEGCKDKDRPLVVIDSGMGGLGILNNLTKQYPAENFIFICDNKMLPLGNKDPKELNRRIGRMIKEIKKINPKGILIACNTIDAISGDSIRASFTSIDVFGIIQSTAEQMLKKTKTKNIAILATKNTTNSKSYMKFALAKKNLNIYGVECVNLAKAIEDDKDVKKTLDEETSVLKDVEFDTLVLGCTHYSYVKDALIKKKFSDKIIIDSSEELIKNYEQNRNKAFDNRANKQKISVVLTKEDDDILKKNLEKVIKNKYTIEGLKI